MKFYVLRQVDWLPNAVRQTNQPKHIKPFLLRITYTIFSSNLHNKLFKTCYSRVNESFYFLILRNSSDFDDFFFKRVYLYII
jgi:hypothetical protein